MSEINELYVEQLLEELASALRDDPIGTLASMPKGACSDACGCPVARWLCDRIQPDADQLIFVDWDERTGQAWCGLRRRSERQPTWIAVPDTVARFIKAFDNGGHPELVAA